MHHEIAVIKQTFGLSAKELADALEVAPVTVERWERGENQPKGLQAAVLRSLHGVAVQQAGRRDDAARQAIRAMILLGVGALIFHLLTKKE